MAHKYPSTHSRAQTYGKSTNQSMGDIETTRSDMRDILWQNAQLLQSEANYRKKVWRYMSRVFYGNKSTEYNFDHWKQKQLPSENDSKHNNNRAKPPTLSNDDVKKDDQESYSMDTGDDLDEMTKEKLALLLDREETFSDFLVTSNPTQVIVMNQVKPKMEQILTAYACAHHNKFPLCGAVQLCAVILTTFNASNRTQNDNVDDGGGGGLESKSPSFGDRADSDCGDTFFILQILTEIMAVYYVDEGKLMKDETLLLLDVLCVNEPQLIDKLNELNIDVIDLSVFVSSWIRCLFAHHFEMEFVQRVIDLVLLEGASVLITIVYGILQFMKNDLTQSHTTAEVFDKLSDKMRYHLKRHDFISRVIQKAQLLFTEENYKYVIKGREKKSWHDLLELPGQNYFRITKGIGDKKMVKKKYEHWRKESRKSIKTIGLGAEESSDEEDENDIDSRGHHARNSSMAFWQNHLDTLKVDGQEKVDELEHQLLQAKEENKRLQAKLKQMGSRQVGIGSVPENEQLHQMEVNGSQMVHGKRPSHVLRSTSSSSDQNHRRLSTLSELLYTSQFGDTIYQEPMADNLAPREIQCRTEEWDMSWKEALQGLDDASISMQGYLCKMTASKWNSRGTLDKIQRRWFVLKGNYMTYFKTNIHNRYNGPKSDKCVNLMHYKVNPVIHSKSKFAFELISPPKPKKKGKSHRHRGDYPQVTGSPYAAHSSHHETLERTKFVLIPDLEAEGDSLQREIRDKWVKSLRLAAKGPVLWDVLLHLQTSEDAETASLSHSQSLPHHHQHSEFITSSHHGVPTVPHHHSKHAQTAFTTSSSGGYGRSSASGRNASGRNASGRSSHGSKPNRNQTQSTISHRSTTRPSRSKHRVGGNTSDYPDYPQYSQSNGKRLSAHSKPQKMTSARSKTVPYGM